MVFNLNSCIIGIDRVLIQSKLQGHSKNAILQSMRNNMWVLLSGDSPQKKTCKSHSWLIFQKRDSCGFLNNLFPTLAFFFFLFIWCPEGYCPSNIFWKVTPFQSKIQVVVFCLLVQGKKGAFLTTPHSLTQKTIDTLDTTSQFHNKWGLEDFWVIKIFNPLILPGSVFKRCGTLVLQTLKYINKS